MAYMLSPIPLKESPTFCSDDNRLFCCIQVYNEVMEVVNRAVKLEVRDSRKSDLHPLGAQTVFSVLDYLTKWRTHRIQLLSAGAPARSGNACFFFALLVFWSFRRCVHIQKL